jgi:hypothetical protein
MIFPLSIPISAFFEIGSPETMKIIICSVLPEDKW